MRSETAPLAETTFPRLSKCLPTRTKWTMQHRISKLPKPRVAPLRSSHPLPRPLPSMVLAMHHFLPPRRMMRDGHPPSPAEAPGPTIRGHPGNDLIATPPHTRHEEMHPWSMLHLPVGTRPNFPSRPLLLQGRTCPVQRPCRRQSPCRRTPVHHLGCRGRRRSMCLIVPGTIPEAETGLACSLRWKLSRTRKECTSDAGTGSIGAAGATIHQSNRGLKTFLGTRSMDPEADFTAPTSVTSMPTLSSHMPITGIPPTCDHRCLFGKPATVPLLPRPNFPR